MRDTARSKIVCFGPFRLDLIAGELCVDGQRTRLQEQPFQVLKMLVEHPGEVVTRDDIRDQLWPNGTIVEFDHSINTAIKKLRAALGDSAEQPRYIETVARRGYRLMLPVESAQTIAPATNAIQSFKSDAGRRWFRPTVSVPIAIALAVVAGIWFVRFRPRHPEPSLVAVPLSAAKREAGHPTLSPDANELVSSPRGLRPRPPGTLVPFTSYPGLQTTPTFSRNGKQVAFSWDGEKGDNFDIYVKMLGAGDPLRLTHNPAAEYFPAWSPDDRHIAFIRLVHDHSEIWMVPALGGAERKLGESSSCGGLSWSPNGRFLALVEKESSQAPYRLALLAVEAGEKHTLTSPPHQYFGDFHPKFSPDGGSIAFIRGSSAVTADLDVLSVNASGEPQREPLQLTSGERIFDLDWTGDSKTIVFSSNRSGGIALWTIPASGGVPERLTLGSDNAFLLSVARNGNDLVYARYLFDSNIWRVAGPHLERNSPPTKLIASTQGEGEPEYSPDGKKIVFNSNRSANWELWICDAAGHDCRQLTSFGGPIPGSPRWSPDGRWIAFDNPQAGNEDIYVISADGGPVHRVTTGPSNNVRPSWSRDGRWIYFGSNRDREWQVWKSSKEGGQAVQVTRVKGAREAVESLDGKFLYYAKLKIPGIWKIPVQGGEETKVLEEGQMSLWALSKDGICFFDLTHPVGPALKFYSFAQRRTMLLQQLPKGTKIPTADRSISVPTDERSILYTQFDRAGGDLMLLENFR